MPRLRLYPTVEELKKQAEILDSLPDAEYERLAKQGIPTVLIKYLKKRKDDSNL